MGHLCSTRCRCHAPRARVSSWYHDGISFARRLQLRTRRSRQTPSAEFRGQQCEAVTFPSGRARLPTGQQIWGAATATNTIGMAVLARLLLPSSRASLRQPSHQRSDVRILVRETQSLVDGPLSGSGPSPSSAKTSAINMATPALGPSLPSCTVAGPGHHPGKPIVLFAGHRNALPCGRRAGNPSNLKPHHGACCIA
jgi:hypothetical protein